MIVKMAMLMSSSVGTMMRMRWTMYPSILRRFLPDPAYPLCSTAPAIGERGSRAASARRRRQLGRGARRAGLLEPEPIRLVDAEMRAGVPVEHPVGRHVLEAGVGGDGLQYAGDKADRIDLIGADAQHLVPDPRLVGRVRRCEPLLVELLQFY